LETNDERKNALAKLKRKNADLIILNSLSEKNSVFGSDKNKVTIFEKGGKEFQFEMKTKQDAARDIVDTIIQLFYE